MKPIERSIIPRKINLPICAKCENFLSCAPIFVHKNDNTHAVCGRCTIPNNEFIRNIQYEIIAKYLRFPCRYKYAGCLERQAFSKNEHLSHEYCCDYKIFKCFLKTNCLWQGMKDDLLIHSKNLHPNRYLKNNCVLTHNLQLSSSKKYIFNVLKQLFIVEIKITKDRLTYTPHFIGEQIMSKKFKYTLNIKNDIFETKRQNNNKNYVSISMKYISEKFGKDSKINFQFTISVKCIQCETEIISKAIHRENFNWLCADCIPGRQSCEHKKFGCKYKDVPLKLIKHEVFFCRYSNQLCSVEQILDFGESWRKKQRNARCAILTDVGYVVCDFATEFETYDLYIYSPLKSDCLADFTCYVKITEPLSEELDVFRPVCCCNTVYDWRIQVCKLDRPIWGTELNIYIRIQRLDYSN